MPEQPPVPPLFSHRFRSPGVVQSLHILIVTLLALLLLIPLYMVGNLVDERGNDYRNALRDIATAWGAKQTLVGPVLVIPYLDSVTRIESTVGEDGQPLATYRDDARKHTAILLPENLEIRANVQEKQRQQGIYDALVYTANVSMTGTFNHDALLRQPVEGELEILWGQAYIMIGLSDTRAIDTTSGFFWNDTRIQPRPGSGLPQLIPTGIHAPLNDTNNSRALHEFKFNMTIRGSEGLYVAPLGQNTLLRMTSGWTSPDFSSDMPPEKQEINDQGFNAEWNISWLARNYPQYWQLGDNPQAYDLYEFTAGAGFGENASNYKNIKHITQYGAFILGLTFLLMLAFERLSTNKNNKPAVMPYMTTGLLICLFYLLLPALAEHLEFLYAYLAAAGLTILAISLNAWLAWSNKALLFSLFVLLTGLYAVLYWLLEMQDYTLLVLTGLLLLAIGIIMFMSRAPMGKTSR